MKICIPSLGRPKGLKTLRLANLIAGPENVYVFLHNEKEREVYEAHNDIQNIIVTGLPPGIATVRNHILNTFPEDEEIVMMDDDIDAVYALSTFKKQELFPLPPDVVRERFAECFTLCRESGAHLWGFYPIRNAFYMKRRINPCGFIIGACTGIINGPLRYDETLKTKEDYDFTLQQIKKYGKALRFDQYTTDAEHHTPGGCSDVWKTRGATEADAEKLLSKWPGALKPNPKRPGELLITLRARRK